MTDNTTPSGADALLQLIESYVEKRHTHGAPQYNVVTARALDAVLSALSAALGEPSGWLPIETSPKDGTEFLAWHRHSTIPIIAFYNEDYDRYECNDGRLVFSLTHWMPLPAPPSAAQQKGASNG